MRNWNWRDEVEMEENRRENQAKISWLDRKLGPLPGISPMSDEERKKTERSLRKQTKRQQRLKREVVRFVVGWVLLLSLTVSFVGTISIAIAGVVYGFGRVIGAW